MSYSSSFWDTIAGHRLAEQLQAKILQKKTQYTIIARGNKELCDCIQTEIKAGKRYVSHIAQCEDPDQMHSSDVDYLVIFEKTE